MNSFRVERSIVMAARFIREPTNGPHELPSLKTTRHSPGPRGNSRFNNRICRIFASVPNMILTTCKLTDKTDVPVLVENHTRPDPRLGLTGLVGSGRVYHQTQPVPARAAEVDVAEFSGVRCAQKETANDIEQVLVEYLQVPSQDTGWEDRLRDDVFVSNGT